MQTRMTLTPAAVLVSASITLTLFVASAQEADKEWKIGPRMLPPPAGASEQLQKAVANMPCALFVGDRDYFARWREMNALSSA